MLHIAIIGSGPAGCYLADHLLKLLPEASVDVLERLPVPFGLIRYGVAPDHQGTKAVARVLDRVLARERVGFFGNVEVGRDVGLDELMLLYDAVVLATGAERDRRLEIPGEDMPGVLGSGAFSGWYNGRPEHPAPQVQDVRSVVIIGNGNVAIDVARVLAKDTSELAGSDLAPEVTTWLQAQPIENIHIVGRRGAADAKFSEHELAELGSLQRVGKFVADPARVNEDSATLKVLRELTARPPRPAPLTVTLHFSQTPAAFLGDDKLSAVQFRAAAGAITKIPAQLAVTCIGYESQTCCTASPTNGTFVNEEGKIKDRLYVVGWAKRGPTGTIPTNRAEAQRVAQKIAQEVAGENRTGGVGLRQLLQQRKVCYVDHAGWRRIDAAELACAGEGRCRKKIRSVAEMLKAAASRDCDSV